MAAAIGAAVPGMRGGALGLEKGLPGMTGPDCDGGPVMLPCG